MESDPPCTVTVALVMPDVAAEAGPAMLSVNIPAVMATSQARGFICVFLTV